MTAARPSIVRSTPVALLVDHAVNAVGLGDPAERLGGHPPASHRVSSAPRARRLLLDGATATGGTTGLLRITSPLYREIAGHGNAVRSVEPTGLLGEPDGRQPVARAGLAQDR